MTRYLRSLIAACVVSGMITSAADAVVVSTTKSTTVAPPDDPGWDNVGVLRGATSIYLGNRWVLTADHLAAGTVTLSNGQSYEAEADSAYQLPNVATPSLNRPSDLQLFRLTEDPGLPPVEIVRETPEVGTEGLIIGNGLDYDASQVYWDVTQQGAKWIWEETTAPGEYSGFRSSGSGVLRWGTNLIEDEEAFGREFDDDITTVLDQSNTKTVTFLTEFDLDGSLADDDVVTADGSTATGFESQAILSDSGGSLFVKDGKGWKLAGTVLAVEGHRDQPDVRRNAIFGTVTHYADLATYLPEIETRYVYGDFDDDVTLDVDDVDALGAAMNASEYEARFDLTRDGRVDFSDREKWVEDVKVTYFGDANLDLSFGTDDLVLVLQSGQYEDTIVGNSTWATGDWNGDGEFDSSDLVIALQSGGFEMGPRGESVSALPASALAGSPVAAVPEPTTHAFLLLAILPLLRRSFGT